MDIKNIVNFIFELNQLKRLKHSGMWLAGVKDPDSVAEHVMRAAQIGYILSVMEGDINPEKVVSIIVMHDNAEARIADQNKVSARYYSNGKAEEKALNDQLELLGETIKKKWYGYYREFEDRNTKEGVVAKDADWLEQAFQAKEYVDQGYKSCQDWIDNTAKAIETDSAKKIMAEMQKTEFTDWWKDLKKMTYTKLDSK
ncbi:HD domain-containing protein [Candidatus Parcubacteria bacterium]|nr:HD domain-containing protein [Candidatus Parcubacteria bacterium]